jgi:hypothetical protein
MLVEELQLTKEGNSLWRKSAEDWLKIMPSAALRYSLNEVKRAGKLLRGPHVDPFKIAHALEVFENWQDCHSYPLKWFADSLSPYLDPLARTTPGPNVNLVQRRKRLEAVIAKLRNNSAVQLTTMQDIAGCRVILPSIGDVVPFASLCRKQWGEHHELKEVDDLVATPRDKTGYRGIHLIYRFRDSDKSFDGRLVEVQFRTYLQHVWATAVETVDLFLNQSLKAGTGDPQWQRFFLLFSAVIAKMELTADVPNTPKGRIDEGLRDELRHYEKLLNVKSLVRMWGSFSQRTFRSAGAARSRYFVMELDVNSRKIDLRGYGEDEAEQAYRDVAMAEQSNPNVLLVTAADLDRLNEAYPNWTFDTGNFFVILQMALGETTL